MVSLGDQLPQSDDFSLALLQTVGDLLLLFLQAIMPFLEISQ